LISDLAKTNDNTNWLIFGDFNIVINSFEKAGGNPIDYNIAEAFRDCLKSCNLEDLGFKRDPYTWHNRQWDNHYIQPRLDRFCASINWSYNFSYYQNMHLLRYRPDHCLILLDFSTSPLTIKITTNLLERNLNRCGLKLKSIQTLSNRLGRFTTMTYRVTWKAP
jgi:hypothetical protein